MRPLVRDFRSRRASCLLDSFHLDRPWSGGRCLERARGCIHVRIVGNFRRFGSSFRISLGLLCGLVLFALTRARPWRWTYDLARYRRTAGWVCLVVPAAVLLGNWFANGYPNTEDFGLLHFIGNTNAPPGLSLLEIALFVVVPRTLLSLPMWPAGRRVAIAYAPLRTATAVCWGIS